MGESTDKVAVTSARRFHVKLQRRTIRLCLLGVLVLAAAIGIFLYLQHLHERRSTQHKLQSNITSVNALGNTNKLKADSNNLIQGEANGTYNVSDKELAKAYSSKGSVELNAGNYSEAVSNFKKAVQLDPSQKELVSYGEFLARYHLGERKTLIPLLESMAAPLKDNHEMGVPELVVMYQGYIADLRAGKDLAL